jgi:hypothetical protein
VRDRTGPHHQSDLKRQDVDRAKRHRGGSGIGAVLGTAPKSVGDLVQGAVAAGGGDYIEIRGGGAGL